MATTNPTPTRFTNGLMPPNKTSPPPEIGGGSLWYKTDDKLYFFNLLVNDWVDVTTSIDLDSAVNILTEKIFNIIDVTYSELDVDHKTYINENLAGKTFKIFQNGINRFLTSSEYSVRAEGGFILVNELNLDDLLVVMGQGVIAGSSKLTPIITFNLPDKFIGNADFIISATSTNTVTPITFSSLDTSKATVYEDSGVWKLHIVAEGAVSIKAEQSASSTYNYGFKDSILTVSSPVISTVSTDVGTVPSTNLFTIKSGANSFVVYTGRDSAGTGKGFKDPKFDIYVQIASLPVKKIKAYMLTKIVFQASAGQTVKISSNVARTFSISQQCHPLTLPNITGTTQAVNSHIISPDFWVTTGGETDAQIKLLSFNSSFKVLSDGTKRRVFIREFDGLSWSQIRWLPIEKSRDLTISCTSKIISIGTIEGSVVNVVLPSGGILQNNTSKQLRVVYPTITGTTYNVSSASSFQSAMAVAISGDEIVLASGTYNLAQNIYVGSYGANVSAGFKGLEGITIRGATGNRSDVIIKPLHSFFSTPLGRIVEGWEIDNSSAISRTYLRDFSIDTSVGGSLNCMSGKFVVSNTNYDGVDPTDTTGINNSFSGILSNTGATLELLLLDSNASNGSADLLNFAGVSSNVTNTRASRVFVINCTGSKSGNFSNSQVITTHFGLDVCITGGTFFDSFLDVVANEQDGLSFTFLEFATFRKGTRKCGINQSAIFDCSIDTAEQINQSTNVILFNELMHSPISNGHSLFRNAKTSTIPWVTPEHNFIIDTTVLANRRAIFNEHEGDLIASLGDIITGFAEGVVHQNFSTSPVSTAIQRVYGTTFVTNVAAISGGELNATIKLGNNAAKGSTNSISNVPTAAVAKYVSEGYNVFDPTVDADFVTLSSDLRTVDADLDSNYFPNVSGNCEIGDNTIYGYIGDRDPWGLLWIHDAQYTPRGARSRPVIHSDALLLPDAY